MPFIYLILSAVFFFAASSPGHAKLFHIGSDECMLVETRVWGSKAPDIKVRRVHPEQDQVILFFSAGFDRSFFFHGIVTTSEGARARAVSDRYECLDADTFENRIHHAHGRIAGQTSGIKGGRQAAGAKMRFQSRSDTAFMGHTFISGLTRLCLLKPILPIGDHVCLRAAREWSVSGKVSIGSEQVRDMLDRACVTKESGPACLLMMIANTPKGTKRNEIFDAAAQQLSAICDIDPAPESCREIAPFRPRVMNLPRPADPAQTNALSITITDIAFRQVVGEEATFRSRCASPTECGAYIDELYAQNSLPLSQTRNLMHALMLQCDFGQNDQRSCHVLAAQWDHSRKLAKSENRDATYLQHVLGGTPNAMDDLIYYDFACNGKNDSLESMRVSSCLKKADILEVGIPGLLSPDRKKASEWYSLICLGTDKQETCRKACELGVQRSCR